MSRIIAVCLAVGLLVGSQAPLVARADDASVCTGTGPAAGVVTACTALIATGKLDTDSQVVAYTQRGYAYESLKQHQDAINDYTAAIAIKPSDTLYFLRGYANEQSGQDVPAIADYTQAIALNAANLQAITRRGFAYLRQHDYAHAQLDFSAALAIDPKAPGVMYGRGVSYEGTNKYDLAVADFSAILAAGPDIDAFRGRADVEFYQQNYAAAAADFAQVLALNPADPYPLIWEHIALLRAKQPDPNFATAAAALDQTTWPATVAKFYLGTIPKNNVFSMAGPAQQCLAEAFVGQWFETQHKHGDAVIYFTRASQICSYGTFEYQSSLVEMQR